MEMNEILIGNTPLVFVENYKGTNIYAKLEYFNATGSVKDRIAYQIIKDAMDSNKLKKGSKIVEGSSGNTGVGLAYVAIKMGLGAIITMPENMTKERISLMKALGAEVILTPKEKGMQGAKDEAERIAKENGYFFANQFENDSNWRAHYFSTAKELVSQLKDIDTVVSPFGTAGTSMGLSKYFKDNNLDINIVAVEPEESPLVTKSVAGPHTIAGIGANFIPKIFDISLLDKVITVKSADAKTAARELASKFGILSGVSGGCAFKAAKQLIDDSYKSKNMVIMIPDTSFRYLSVGIYD